MVVESTIRSLLRWFASARRSLPWREHASPWRTLVSELMLQQTRVAVVAPRFESFLLRFPNPAAMAAATEDEVLALWSGLGYYRRARYLHAAAREIMARHDGCVPNDRAALRALPGIGDYTAGAVLSIAFGQPEPVVDGNVERVFARRFGIEGNVKRGSAKKHIREFAREAVRAGPPGQVNQALMELGALVCTPTGPKCDRCPIALDCRALAGGNPEALPTLPPRKATVSVTLAVALAVRDGGVLLVRHPEGGFLSGTWGPPFVGIAGSEPPGEALARSARSQGYRLTAGKLVGTFRHQITHHRITGRCFAAEIGENPSGQDAQLVPRADLATVGLSSFAHKALGCIPPG